MKWEVRKSFNIGLDFSTLSNRLYGTIDVFNDNTSDMLFLYDLPQPPFLSPTVYANAASAFNKGVEVTLGAAVIKKNNFAWNVQGNIATLKNSITGLLGTFKGADLSLTNRHYGYAFGGGFGGTYVTQLEVGTLRVFFGSHNMLVLIMPGINYLTTTMPRGILPVLLPAIQTRIVCILIQPHIIPGVLQIVLPI